MANHRSASQQALIEARALLRYIEDFSKMSGGAMAAKYGDDPMDGFGNVVRRAQATVEKIADLGVGPRRHTRCAVPSEDPFSTGDGFTHPADEEQAIQDECNEAAGR